jgi:hypothetical protein
VGKMLLLRGCCLQVVLYLYEAPRKISEGAPVIVGALVDGVKNHEVNVVRTVLLCASGQ